MLRRGHADRCLRPRSGGGAAPHRSPAGGSLSERPVTQEPGQAQGPAGGPVPSTHVQMQEPRAQGTRMAQAAATGMQTASPKCPGEGEESGSGHPDLPVRGGGVGLLLRPPPPHLQCALTWIPFSCRFRYRVLTGMLAGTSASSLRVQITRLAWLLQEQAAGHEVAGGEPPPAARVKATPPPPAPSGGEISQRKSRAPRGQDILPGGSGGHGEPRARAILNVHAPGGRRGAVGDREGQAQRGT